MNWYLLVHDEDEGTRGGVGRAEAARCGNSGAIVVHVRR